MTMMRLFTLFGFVLTFAFANPAQARDKFLDIQDITTDKGIKIWLVEDDSIPVLSMDFAFKGAGAIRDPEGKQGTARLLSNMLDEGAGELESEAFQKELRDLSISLGFSSNRDNFGGNLKTLSQNQDRAFELLKLALNEPRFDEEPLERMVAANQSRIRSSLSDPDWIAARILNDKAFEGHPYAQNSGGTLSSLAAITAEDLRNFKETHLTRDRLHIAVAGNIDAETLSAKVDEVFGDLPESVPESEIAKLELQNKARLFLYDKDIPQSIIEIMQKGIGRDDPDYHTAQIMNFILGSSGFGSRLTEEIREKRGLTYGIYSYFNNMDYFNGLGVSTSTANKNVQEMLNLIEAEFNKLRSHPISEDELANAKSYLIGSLPLSLTSTDKISGLLLSLQVDGLGTDYLDKRQEAIEKATLEDVFRVSQKLLSPENFVTVLVGRPANITPDETIEDLPNVE
ncbi:MAG: M16 family metallopeptidase [Alphaproteobacteria bacterium]